MVQIFQVEKGTDVADQVADFLVLILIIQIDNGLIDTPLYLSFNYNYTELWENLPDKVGGHILKSKVMEFGTENIKIPNEEKELIDKWWDWSKFMHWGLILIYVAATVFNVFGIVTIQKNDEAKDVT